MNAPGEHAGARLLTPRRLMLLGVLAGYCALVLFPGIRWRLGLFDRGVWFLDSYAVLAASDAVQAGLDPFKGNPLDVLERPHSYSGWWFGLGEIGLTRRHNFLVGGLWVAAFALAAAACLRPSSWGEAGIGAAVLLSPPVMLAVNRANNDLVVFAVLAAGLLALRGAERWRIGVFIGAVTVATGLKFYPVIAGFPLLLLHPARRGIGAAGLCAIAAGLALAGVWSDFRQATFPVPTQLHLFGAAILRRDLGWDGIEAARWAGWILLAVGAWASHRRGWAVSLTREPALLVERSLFAAGAVLLTGCFAAGISYAYRLIFVIFLLPFLWRTSARRPALLTLGAILVVLWLDGFYCVAANSLATGPSPAGEIARRQWIWRLTTQPVVWAAMMLLGGSVMGGLASVWREWRSREAGA